MPKVDMDMSHGTLAVWHVAEGAAVRKGDALFDIETDKAAMEVEAPADGRLHHVRVAAGARVAVGTAIAWIYGEGEPVGPPPVAATPAADPDATAETDLMRSAEGPAGADAAPRPAEPDGAGQDAGGGLPAARRPAAPDHLAPQDNAARDNAARDRVPAGSGLPAVARRRATPAARALARDNGLDLAEPDLAGLVGSGPAGRLQRSDVETFLVGRAGRDDGPLPSPDLAIHPQPGPLAVTRKPGVGVPIVLLHGFAADGPSFLPLEKALAGQAGAVRPVIRIDLPGHGRSPRRRVDSFAALARMLAEAFDAATAGDDRVHLVGHSLGGALAIALADIRAPRLASLGLIAPAGLGPEIDGDTIRGLARASREESLGPWLRRLVADPATIGDDYVRAAMAPRRDPALRACQAAMAEALFPDGVQAFDLRPALRRLAAAARPVPAALVWGRADAVLPWRQALAVPGECGIHLLEGAGHLPQIEAPEQVARVLARLFAAAEAAR